MNPVFFLYFVDRFVLNKKANPRAFSYDWLIKDLAF